MLHEFPGERRRISFAFHLDGWADFCDDAVLPNLDGWADFCDDAVLPRVRTVITASHFIADRKPLVLIADRMPCRSRRPPFLRDDNVADGQAHP